MAEGVVPSRDEIYAALRDLDIAPLGSLAAFYLSGRLFDREAIDYEAAVDHLLAGAPDGILDEMSREEWLKYAKPLVDAALVDTE